MLEAIRKRSASLVVKLLLLLLVLSFGLWGIGDYISPNPEHEWVAKVGDVEIPDQILRDQYQSELRRLRQVLGDNLDREQALALGLPAHALQQIVNRTLLDLGGADLGLVVSDDILRQTIQSNPAFHGPRGQFDKRIFDQLVRNSGLTEAGFLDTVRGEIVRGQLIGSTMAGAVPPRVLVEQIYRYRNEQRVVQYVRIDNSTITDLPTPDETKLRAFYEENPTLFTAPEYRSVTAIVLNAADLAPELSVTDEELEAAFQDRSEEFNEPERRALEQITFTDREAGQRANDRIAAGDDFALVAEEEAGLDADDIQLGIVSRDQILPELADIAFQTPEGSVTELTQSPLGWHLIRVTSISPAQRKTLGDVRDQLRQELAGDKAFDALIEQSDRLEDALAGGATLEEAAAELGARLLKIAAIDNNGLDSAGNPVDDVPEGLIDTVFDTGENSESSLTEADGGGSYFVVRVDKVTPASPKPFEMARDGVVSAWTRANRAEAAEEIANLIAREIQQGRPLSEAAADHGLTVRTSPSMTRSGEGATEGMDRSLINSAFETELEKLFVAKGQDASFVGMAIKVIAADPVSNPGELSALEASVQGSRNNELLSELTAALTQRHSVEINNQALNQLY